ncbi:MAG: transglutaminase domain-containing protein [Myxococcales bacterium]|nr:transglutaminase domain-containing protein [Myxococcales bacterium]
MPKKRARTVAPMIRRLPGMKEAPIHTYHVWTETMLPARELAPRPMPTPTPMPLPAPTPGATHPEMIGMVTKHEGAITYLRHWNFWVRVGTPAQTDKPDYYFHNYEDNSPAVQALVAALGVPTAWPRTQEEIWGRIAAVWNWLGAHVRVDGDAYSGITSADRWPSIGEFAAYYAAHGELVWSACFTKAHLFATLLGRVLPRWHVTIASGHHTENGAPPTASHVFVGVYLSDRWYHLDPTAVYGGRLPSYAERRSVGLFASVDYEHPFSAIPVPLSDLRYVPHLPE